MTSLQISPAGLIIKEKDCKKFWTMQSKELSDKLWLPSKTECADLDLNSSNMLSSHLVEKSWFSTNLKVPLKKKWSKISQASFISSVADYMGSEDIKKPLKKQVKVKKCLFCEEIVETITNKFLCATHFLEHINDEKCNAIKKNKEKCCYNSSYNGFCAHHIDIPKNEEKKNFNTSRKILLNPTHEQKIILKQWLGISRKCYNEAVFNLNKKN
jgi:hypothetical protein